MLLSPPEQGPRNLLQSVFSFDDSVMLAAVICLLVVIFFVLLLHIYAKWFLSQSRSRRTPVVSVSQVLGPTRFRSFDPFPFDTDYPTKGLDFSVIASIPLFVYESDQKNQELECVICLSVFKGGELGRKLPKCWHGFHVECIDMWLGSHSSCPICRAPAAVAGGSEVGEIDSVSDADVVSDSVNEEDALEIVVEVLNADRESEVGGRSGGDSSVVASSLSSQAAAIGESLKRMLSKSRSERKVRPLSDVVNDSDG